MKKQGMPAIHVPIQKTDGSMEWVWYMFLQQLNTNASEGGSDLSKGIDGGFANSVYLAIQKIDGGNANG